MNRTKISIKTKVATPCKYGSFEQPSYVTLTKEIRQNERLLKVHLDIVERQGERKERIAAGSYRAPGDLLMKTFLEVPLKLREIPGEVEMKECGEEVFLELVPVPHGAVLCDGEVCVELEQPRPVDGSASSIECAEGWVVGYGKQALEAWQGESSERVKLLAVSDLHRWVRDTQRVVSQFCEARALRWVYEQGVEGRLHVQGDFDCWGRHAGAGERDCSCIAKIAADEPLFVPGPSQLAVCSEYAENAKCPYFHLGERSECIGGFYFGGRLTCDSEQIHMDTDRVAQGVAAAEPTALGPPLN